MIQTVPYAAAATAEIMSRYRPIAPKPEAPGNDDSALPKGFRKSPYLMSIWAHLQARPTRTRKRGRAASAALSPPYGKRTRACPRGLIPPLQVANSSPAKSLTWGETSHVPINCGLRPVMETLAVPVAVSVLNSTSDQSKRGEGSFTECIDLNTAAGELDFQPEVQEPVKPAVLSPKPVRPVWSRIIITSITGSQIIDSPGVPAKTPEEIEAALEAEPSPAIVSDSKNKVRLTNLAYREMVGQPECGWLDCAGGGGGRRIGGEVLIEFRGWELRQAAVGFDCSVRMEWESEGKKKRVNACGSVVKVESRVRDYLFLWRFHGELKA